MSGEIFDQAKEPKPRDRSRLPLLGRKLLGVVSAGLSSEAYWCRKAVVYQDPVAVSNRASNLQARAEQLMAYGLSDTTAHQRASLERFCADQAWIPIDSASLRRDLKRDGFFVEKIAGRAASFVDFPDGWHMMPACEDPENITDAYVVDPEGAPRYVIHYQDNVYNPLHRAMVS